MSKIIRNEFLGEKWVFFLLCITVVGIPWAILYLRDSTIKVEEEMPDPTAFLEAYRSGKIPGGR
ncbi:MAG: hypothetical protein HY717_08305 [Planctomycetes bacterium]|nr:hypothetical protein [Planctomycetota bacterium]